LRTVSVLLVLQIAPPGKKALLPESVLSSTVSVPPTSLKIPRPPSTATFSDNVRVGT